MASKVIAAGDVILIVMKGNLFAQSVQSTFYLRCTETTGNYTILNLLNGLQGILLDAYVKCVSRDWTGQVLYGRIVAPTKSRGEELILGTPSGDILEDALPPSVAGVISRYTLVPGPGGRGRVFVPAVPETWNSSGLLSQAGVDAYEELAQFMSATITPQAGHVFEAVLWKRPNIALPVTDTVTQRVLRSQRRREIGVGI